MNPHAAQLWAEITKPNLFDDKSTDWYQFDREWKRYEQLTAATGLPMPDPIKLEVLKSRVGTVSRLLIQRMEEENPHRTFAEYYGALAKMYAKDASEQARLAWNRVQLKIGPDGILTLEAFRKFAAEFQVCRNRVADWTPTEEYSLLFKRLPPAWGVRVKEEEQKRGRSKVWVRLTNVPDITAGALREALVAEGIAIRGVQTTDGGFLIDTESEATQDALLAMDGRVLEGKAVKAARTQVKMTGTEILAWVEEKLKVQQEAKELSFQGDSQPYPQLFHQAQEMGPTEQANGFQLMRPSPPNTLTVHMAKQTEVIGEQNSENQPPTRFQPDGWKGGRGRGGKDHISCPPLPRPPNQTNVRLNSLIISLNLGRAMQKVEV